MNNLDFSTAAPQNDFDLIPAGTLAFGILSFALSVVLDARSLPWSVRLTHRPTSSSRMSMQVQQSNLGSG